MEWISIVVGALVFAVTLWGSIKIFDRYNSHNTLAVAAIIGLVFSFAAAAGTVMFLLPLVALMYLLVAFYDLGILRAFAVVGSMIAMQLALAEGLRAIL